MNYFIKSDGAIPIDLPDLDYIDERSIHLVSDGAIPIDLPDLDYIDERSIHLVSPTIVIHSLKNSPVSL
ncbi:unnamed protein product [Brugia pahangi]|uniref:AraC family transcriptional regulator n=1 Tax=Brugia pahangi TaxID=6280 RepID=A0A0N4T6X3_BRUPA|nr:unnamed protein product [Brugia pahangi]